MNEQSRSHAVRSPKPGAAPAVVLQRQCACGAHTPAGGKCAELKNKDRTLQRKTMPAGRDFDAIPDAVHEVLRSPGRPLDAAVRADMEPRFKRDFSGVRVHTDAAAARSAESVGALAYAAGENLVFGAGRFVPATASGKHLLAHELAHVVQQGGAASFQRFSPSSPGDNLEHEANSAADAVVAGRPLPSISSALSGMQRQAAPVAAPGAAGGAAPAVCPIAALTPVTDPDALAMEGGATVIWNNTAAGLQAAANSLIALVQAEPKGSSTGVQSAYRPQSYQDHLREVWDRAHDLRGNTSPACDLVRTAVNQEMAHHGLSIDRLVGKTSNHTSGRAVDINWSLPSAKDKEATIDALAAKAGLVHRHHTADLPHFELL